MSFFCVLDDMFRWNSFTYRFLFIKKRKKEKGPRSTQTLRLQIHHLTFLFRHFSIFQQKVPFAKDHKIENCGLVIISTIRLKGFFFNLCESLATILVHSVPFGLGKREFRRHCLGEWIRRGEKLNFIYQVYNRTCCCFLTFFWHCFLCEYKGKVTRVKVKSRWMDDNFFNNCQCVAYVARAMIIFAIISDECFYTLTDLLSLLVYTSLQITSP